MSEQVDLSQFVVDEVINFTVCIDETQKSKRTKSPWKRVSKEEFYAFIKAYPNKLDFDTTGICDPPLSSYNDFSRGMWPDSMIGKIYRNDMMPKEWNAGDNEYFIRTE